MAATGTLPAILFIFLPAIIILIEYDFPGGQTA